MQEGIDPQIFKDIIETRRMNKHKRCTAQSFRDHNRIVMRMEQIGVKMDVVSAYLERMFKCRLTTSFLLLIALPLIERLKIPIDRLAKRNRTALLCWFAEHWEEISPHITDLSTPSNIKKEKPCMVFDPFDVSQLLNIH